MRIHTTVIVLATAVAAVAQDLSFNRDIRPILSDKCFACHGFDAKTREADLRIDTPEGAFTKNKDGKAAIVAGKLDESMVWERITSTDKDDVMPPPESHKELSAAEKETLKKWIEQGAPYQKHWAFEPPVKPPVPEGAGNEIDRFLAARLKQDGRAFSAEAPRELLIRRVSFTLTGLPPKVEDVDAFLSDAAPDAYDRMVDRYLASPHYGEEMARLWLDVARYADTHGLHLDNERQTWAYRDWVVSAFNRDLPYDKFTIEQLAGDLIPNATQDQQVATGFNRCNVTTSEGGSIDAEFVFRYAVDRASTTSQAWLGLTAGCAVCHDHKYDPITAKDFYSLYAFFHSNADPAMDGNALLTQPVMKVKPPGYDAKIKAFDERISDANAKMEEKAKTVAYADPAEQNPPPAVTTLDNVWFEDAFPEGAQFQASGHPTAFVDTPVTSGKKSLKRGGPEMAQDYYQAGAQPLEVPQGGKFFVHVYLDPNDLPEEVMIQFHTDGWKHRALWGQDIIEFGAKGTTERFVAGPLPEAGKWVKLEVPAEKMGLAAGAKVAGYAFTVHGGTCFFDKMGVAGSVDPVNDPASSFLAWRKAQKGKDTAGAPGDVNGWLKEGPEKERKPEEVQKMREFYVRTVCASTRSHFQAELAEQAAAKKERNDYDAAAPSTFVWKDLDKPRESFVMTRGAYDKPGEKVEPATPAFLPAMKKEAERRANRMDLANWLVARENPLTARVAVNRFWQQMFGVGLVKSSHDFGTQGDLPSHAELLDWLSVWFQDNQWDVKKLLRLMLTSTAFRQHSAAPADAWTRDPENRFLARGPRFRLDAEHLRDQALFVSGLISLETGGKGVNPYQPPNIWEPVGFAGSNTQNYRRDNGPALYRRTLYTFFKRTAPHPIFANFDAPNREQSCIRRERSNTPLQALQLMNDVQFYEAACGLARRMIAPAATPEESIAFAFRSILARKPAPEETAAAMELYTRQLAKYQAAPETATKAITFGESKPPPGINEPELAAWSLIANLILNMDEASVRN